MTYSEHLPTIPLSRLIDKFWYCSAPELTGSTLTIPLLNHELVFNFSENFNIGDKRIKESLIENPIAWINGIQSKAYYSFTSGRHEMLGVLFKPHGLKAFLKYDSIDFADAFIDAGLVFGKAIETLINKMQEANVVTDKIDLIERFLLQRKLPVNSPEYLSYSLNMLPGSFGASGGIIDVCNQVSTSNKSLIKTFRKHIGINPKKYSHLQVINAAIALLSKDPCQSFTKLAHKLNFYDQAHFNKLFKSITSITPTQYSACVINKQTDTLSPNFISALG